MSPQRRRSALRPSLLRLSVFLACFAYVEAALAQAALEEVVVVARKREQLLEDVPIAVSAYDAVQLRVAGVHDVRDLMSLSPFLAVHATQAETAGSIFRIRGIGTGGDNLGLESSVGVFIDGVYRNRNSVALNELGEIERIEVLRGPQNTLFGKNTTAGLINIITKRPDSVGLQANVTATLGDYDSAGISGGVTGPLGGERFAFRLDGSASMRDGFVDNLAAPGVSYNDRDRRFFRAQIAGEINDDVDLRIIADYSDRDETCCAAVTMIQGPSEAALLAVGATPAPPDPFARQIAANSDWGYEQGLEEKGLSAELNWSLRDARLTSITATREWAAARSQDADFSDADILYRAPGSYENRFDTNTQEIRLAGERGRLAWLVGLYFVDETLHYRDAARVGADFGNYVNALIVGSGQAGMGLLPDGAFVGGEGARLDVWRQDTQSSALFTHNIWNVSDRISLTAGLRYTVEDKDLSGSLAAANPGCIGIATGQIVVGSVGAALACNPLINPFVDNNPALNPNPAAAAGYFDTRSDKEWSGTLNAAFDFTDLVLGYVSYSAGYKAGGYNLDRAGLANPLLGQLPRASDLEFAAETVDSYEIGARIVMRGGRMRFNAAAFSAEFSDYQLNLFNGTNFVVDNQGEVDSTGIELEFQARPRDAVRILSGVTYADVRYADSVASANLAGKRINLSPYWIVNAGLTYERAVFETFTGFVHVNYRYSSSLNTGGDLDPAKVQGAYRIVNMTVGIGPDDERWQLELWGRNVLDEDYRQVVFSAALRPGTYQAFLGDPRTWGATIRFRF